jgi:hypothetical protein
LQQKYALTTEEIQEVTQQQTLRGLTIPQLEQVILCLNNYCLNRRPVSRTMGHPSSEMANLAEEIAAAAEQPSPEPSRLSQPSPMETSSEDRDQPEPAGDSDESMMALPPAPEGQTEESPEVPKSVGGARKPKKSAR